MQTQLERIWNNPAILYALVEVAIVLGVAFGLDVTVEQTGAIMAGVALLTGVGVRNQVTPTRKHDLDHG